MPAPAPAARKDPATLGPMTGAKLPAFEARDAAGRLRAFDSLKGPNGLILVLFRSADWCPFCKAQLVDLQSGLAGFTRRGYGVAALSYDSPEALADFAGRRGIAFPLLSDPESRVIRAFGLLNDVDYPPGHYAHGVPYPVTFVVDSRGVITSRHTETEYAQRRTAASLLALLDGGARALAPAEETSGAGRVAVETSEVKVRLSASNETVTPGQRLSLFIDFNLGPNIHAYAPGAASYRPVALTLDPTPLFESRPLTLPPSHIYRFEPLQESIPVFTGSFRALQDIMLAGATPAMLERLASPSPSLTVEGTLQYQVCSDTLCHAPVKTRVSWTLSLRPFDRDRVPSGLRRSQ